MFDSQRYFGKMIVKVLSVVSLLKICAGDIPSSLQSDSDHAVYSQSFVRHDVPLSYQYSAVHIYSTPKPNQYIHKPLIPQQQPDRTQLNTKIQYAPIDNVPSNQKEESTEKTHLEPKPLEHQNLANSPQHLAYIPGYNIEVLQSVNRYPGHNAVYRSYPHISPNDRINKINFLNQYVRHKNPAEEYQTVAQISNHSTITYQPVNPVIQATFSPFAPNKFNPGFKPPLYNPLRVANANQFKYVPAQFTHVEEEIPHPKAHKMLLNIARTYNIAHSPLQAQQHPSFTLLRSVPAHVQSVAELQNPASVNRNTRLHPVPNKHRKPSAHRQS